MEDSEPDDAFVEMALDWLQSPHRAQRIRGCRALGNMETLSGAVVLALQDALSDPDPEVAEAAAQALAGFEAEEQAESTEAEEAKGSPAADYAQPDGQFRPQVLSPPASVGEPVFEQAPGCLPFFLRSFGLLALIVAGYWVAAMSQTLDVTCERLKPGGRADCMAESRLLDMLPIGRTEILDARAASVVAFRMADVQLPLTRLEVTPPSGRVPLSVWWRTDSGAQQRLAERLDIFLRDGGSSGPLRLFLPRIELDFEVLAYILLAFLLVLWWALRWITRVLRTELPDHT